MSGIRPPDCSKLAKNPKSSNDLTIFRHDINVRFFWRCFVSLVKFSYWPKFHVNIITGSETLTIFFYKGLTRNLEIGNTPVWALPNIWRLGRVMDTKFGRNVSNRILLKAAKFQGYSFYCFWVIKGKPTEGAGKVTPIHTHTHARTHARTHACTHTLGLINVMYVISSLLVSDLSNLHLPRKSKQNKHFRYHIYFCI